MTKEILLTQGQVAIVDDTDFGFLSQWKWYAHLKNHWYARRSIRCADGRQTAVHMHRVIIGANAGEEVDHIDGNGLNNTRANLRLCSDSQNSYNQRIVRPNVSGYKGVTWHKHTMRWRAQIGFEHKYKHLGLFGTAEEAALAYDEAARQLFGEFAYTNFPYIGSDPEQPTLLDVIREVKYT